MEEKIKRQLIHFSTNEAIYERFKTTLESSWDSISRHYSVPSEVNNEERIADLRLFKRIGLARVEMETGQTALDLLKNGVLKEIPAKKIAETGIRIRVGCEHENILKGCIDLLNEAAAIEEKTSAIINDITTYGMKTCPSGIRVMIGRNDHVLVPDNPHCVGLLKPSPSGLTCTVEFFGCVLEGSVIIESSSVVSGFELSLRERSIESRHVIGDVTVNICRGVSAKKNNLCQYVLRCLLNGCEILELIDDIFYYIACYIGRKTVPDSVTLHRTIDGNSYVVYVLNPREALKIVISQDGQIKCSLNGYPFQLENKLL